MTESPTEEVVGSGRNLDEKGVDSTAIVANAADDAAAALPGSSSDSASAINSPIQGDENELIEPVDAEQLEPVADANDDCDDDDNNTAREGPTLSASAGASHSGQTQQPSTVANSGVIAKAQIPCASSDDGSVQKTSDSATTTTTLVATVESAPADSAAVAGGTGTSANSSAGTPKKGRRRKAMGVATGRAGVAGSHSGTPRAGAATTPASAAVAAAATLVKTGPPWVMPTPTTEEELKAAIEEIRGHTNLPTPPIPIPPKFDSRTSIKARIKRLQQYISSFEYNHTGTRYFPVHKDKGQLKLTDTAKQIMREALPIQCLEAVMLGCYLTTKWQGVDRVPISFKSFVKPINRSFRHIVLAIRFQGKWGAIGLSRKDTLMYKKVHFPSLSALIKDYQEAYDKCWHVLKKVYIGFPFRHDPMSVAPIKWRVLNLRVDKHPWDEVADSLDTYARDLKKLAAHFHAHKRLPDSFDSTYIFKKAPLKVAPYTGGSTLGSPKVGAGGSSSTTGTPKSSSRAARGGATPKGGSGRRSRSTGDSVGSGRRIPVVDPNASSDEDDTATGGANGPRADSDASSVKSKPAIPADGKSAGQSCRQDEDNQNRDSDDNRQNTRSGSASDDEDEEIAEAPKVTNTQINQAFLAV